MKLSFITPLPFIIGLTTLTGLGCTVTACGHNRLAERAPPAKQELAEEAMEQKNYAKAITLLNELLQEFPENHQARSLLAAAYAAQADVIVLQMLLETLSNSGESAEQNNNEGSDENGGNGNAFKLFAQILPEYDVLKVQLLQQANTHMKIIPENLKTYGMRTQQGFFQSALGFLVMKQFATTDFSIDPEKLQTMSAEEALLILESLEGAGDSFGNEGAGAAIAQINQNINASEGATRQEKLKNYMATLGKSS